MKKVILLGLFLIALSGCIRVEIPAQEAKPTYTNIPTRTPKPTITPFPTRTPRPTRTPFPTRTPTPPWSSCDIKYSAASHVIMWAEGNYAHEACDVINTRMHASTVLNNSTGSKYFVVCSDEFLYLAYEVIDTGDYAYGYEWCNWMYLQYGATSKRGQEDIFKLIGQ